METIKISKQEILNLKKENQKLKENYENFMKIVTVTEFTTAKKPSETPKIDLKLVKEFMESQKCLIESTNEHFHTILKDVSEVKSDFSSDTYIENFIKAPGLKHVAEKILWNLDRRDLDTCRGINQTFRKYLDDPFFWLENLIQRGLSKETKIILNKAIPKSNEIQLEKFVLLFLKKCWKKPIQHVPGYIDGSFLKKNTATIQKYLSCYESLHVQNEIQGILRSACSANRVTEVKILAPLTYQLGSNLIYSAAISSIQVEINLCLEKFRDQK